MCFLCRRRLKRSQSVVSVCAEGEEGLCLPVRRPHCCMRKRLSLPLSLYPWRGMQSKETLQSYSLSNVTGSSIAHHSAILRGGEGGDRGGGGRTMGAVCLLQCLHKYLRIIRRFQRGYYAIFLLILLWLLQATEKRAEREREERE